MTSKHNNSDLIFTRKFTLISLVNMFLYLGYQMMLTGLPLFAIARGADPIYAGLLTTVAAIAAIVVLPFSGFAVDSIGRRPVFIVSILTMIVLSIGYLAFPTGAVGLVIRAFHGIAWGFASTANSTIPLDVISPRRFTESMAIFTIFSSAAMAISPSLASVLSEKNYENWIIYGFIIFSVITLILLLYLFKNDYKDPVVRNNASLKDILRIDRLFNASALFPSAVACFMASANGAFQTFFNLMCEDRGLTATYIYYVTFALITMTFKPVIGNIADKHGYFLPGVITCVLCGVSMIYVAFTHSNVMLLISGVVVGLGMGCSAVVLQAMAVSRADEASKGAATSTYKLFLNIGVSIGGTLGGILVSYISYTGMFITIGIIALIGALIFAASGRKRIESYRITSR